jgi:hypothetical protein
MEYDEIKWELGNGFCRFENALITGCVHSAILIGDVGDDGDAGILILRSIYFPLKENRFLIYDEGASARRRENYQQKCC